MKKLFISCPMRGRSEEAIKASMEQMHKIAEAVFGEELEVIQTYIEDDPPQNSQAAIWYLGESIKMMSQADYFIGVYDPERRFDGCMIENTVASKYKVRTYLVNLNFVAPDVMAQREASKNRYDAGIMLC